MISTGNLKTAQKVLQWFTHISHVAFDFFWHPEISQSTVYPTLQGRDTHVSPGVDLSPRRQQHPADLPVAFERRPVQRGAAPAPVVLRGHGAGHRPQQVAHRAEVTVHGRPDDVIAASGGHGPPQEGTGGRAANPIPLVGIRWKSHEIIFGKML